MKRILQLTAGLGDSGFAALGTFLAGVLAVRELDVQLLAVYAVLASATIFAMPLSRQLVYLPSQVASNLRTHVVMPVLRHEIRRALPLHAAGIAIVLAVAATLLPGHDVRGVLAVALTGAAPKPWAKAFFTGVPSPPGALLVIVPIVIEQQFGKTIFTNLYLVSVWTILIGLLMVSTLPTIALKSIRIPPKLVVPLLVILVFSLVTFLFQPRIVALIGIAVYLLHIPFAGYRYRYISQHPELWDVEREPRRRRTNRRQLRLTVRTPRRARVAGRLPDGSPAPKERFRDSRVVRRPRGIRRNLPPDR